MAPCLVVERLEGQHRCSRAPVGEHAVGQARQYTMWLFTRNKRSAKNNKNLHCGSPSHHHDRAQLRQHPLLHSCGANPPGLWQALAACDGDDSPQWGHISTIFARCLLVLSGFVFLLFVLSSLLCVFCSFTGGVEYKLNWWGVDIWVCVCWCAGHVRQVVSILNSVGWWLNHKTTFPTL